MQKQLGFWFKTVCIRPILPTMSFALTFIYSLNWSRIFPFRYFNFQPISDHMNCCQLLLYLFGVPCQKIKYQPITDTLRIHVFLQFYRYQMDITGFSEFQKYRYGWVARGNLTPAPSQNGTWQSPVIPLLPAFLLKPHGLKPTQKETRLLPVSWLTIACCELTHPLRSSPITGPSTLILDDPPLCLASVLSRLWDRHLRFSLNIKTTASHVPHKSLDQVHAISMPDAAQTINRLPLGLSCRPPSTRSFDPISDISTPHRMVRLRSSPWSIPDMVFAMPFP
jgi:hypothetical protein